MDVREEARLAALALERLGRRAMGHVLRSKVLRWRYGGPPADQLLLVPQDLRTADPSFAVELANGHFGLAGALALTGGGSPFAIRPPSAEWQKELLGFGWLRHLRAACLSGDAEARETALSLVRDWIRRARRPHGPGWEAAIVARRLISWLSHSGFLLEGASQRDYDALLRSLDMQMRYLGGALHEMPAGAPRLTALTALVMAGLAIADQEHVLDEHERPFIAELERQIEADGAHVSRNTGVLIELLLDLLPLRQCFAVRDRLVPDALDAAIARALAMLRHMRLGDGHLARFNGVGATATDALATVLAYDETQGVELPRETRGGYCRLQRRQSLLIMDAAPPPPLVLAGEAHAGALSFELSSGRHPLIVNCGAPGPAHQDWRLTARATASHSTLTLDDSSSARLVRRSGLERHIGAPPLAGPTRVERRIEEPGEGAIAVEAWHDGYLGALGLIHERRLRLDAMGHVLEGEDRLRLASRGARIASAGEPAVSFAVHFHLHPAVEATLAEDAGRVRLRLVDGHVWHFEAVGLVPLLEESVYLAEFSGPRRSVQIVLRGTARGETSIAWRLARVPDSG